MNLTRRTMALYNESKYHFWAYKYQNGCILLSGSARLFRVAEEPKTVKALLALLASRNFARERLTQCAYADGSIMEREEPTLKVTYILVEKRTCFEGHRDEAVLVHFSRVDKLPVCIICSRETRYGSLCLRCDKRYCKSCEPDLYYQDIDGRFDEVFSVRLVKMPHCGVCLSI